jgi:DNA invertase Pin-like site-specific DNA recombinase
LDRQLISLKEFGVAEENIFTDKASGKDFNRPAFRKMLATVREGDTLVVKSIDRLGRNYDQIIEFWRILTKEKKVYIVVLDMSLLDTRKRTEDMTGAFIADLVLQIMSYFSMVERALMISRVNEGIAAAKKRGVRFGHKPMEKPPMFEEIKEIYLRGEISRREAGRRLHVSRHTFGKWVGELGTNGYPLKAGKKSAGKEDEAKKSAGAKIAVKKSAEEKGKEKKIDEKEI